MPRIGSHGASLDQRAPGFSLVLHVPDPAAERDLIGAFGLGRSASDEIKPCERA
jgi:hypothetical protein